MKRIDHTAPQAWLLPLTYALLVAAGTGCVLLKSAASLVLVTAFTVGLSGLLFGEFSMFSVGPKGLQANRDQKAMALTAEFNDEARPAIRKLEIAPLTQAEALEQLELGEKYEAQERQAEEERRRAVNDLITDAAEWGLALAQIGFSTPPRPRIEWRDGEPFILSGVGDPEGMRGSRLGGTLRPGYDKPGEEITDDL